MRKLLNRPAALAVLLLVIYLLGLIISAFTISAYPLLRQRQFLIQETRGIAQTYPNSTEAELRLWLDGKLEGQMRALIYSSDGICLLDMSSTSGSGPVVPYEASLPSVLAGEETFRLVFDQAPSARLHSLMGVAGIPIMEHDTVIGAAFLVKKTIAVTESLVGYAVYFTILYWLSAIIIVSGTNRKKKLEELQQTYIANVTHALKTPVASIKALVETLCDGLETDPDIQQTYYGMILQEVNRQGHMVQDILELSKLQSNTTSFTKTGVQIEEVLDPVLEKYVILCDCREITLHISEDVARLPVLPTNTSCLKQLFEILLDNALKFVPEGGDIWIEAATARDVVTFCVRDSGIGISQEALPHVFERFYKCSHDFNESGSGLGLAIAEKIIDGLREKIWAESELGRGSAFYFTVHLK